jgi:hypothetical protein
MGKTIRFHLDEHASKALANALRQCGIDVTRTPEVGLLHATDAEQLAYASANARTIVTHDPDFLTLNALGVEHAGIAYCPATKYRLRDLILALVTVWEVYDSAELRNQVEYL